MTDNKQFYDEEEREFVEAYKRGDYVLSENQEALKAQAEEAARNYLKKDARINIRLSTADLMMLKRRAAEEGMPYQTLVASILHKYVSGRLGI